MSDPGDEPFTISVLIVDDTDEDRFVLQRLLQRSALECRIEEARNCAEARTAYATLLPDVIFFDHRLPDGRGADLMTELRLRALQQDHHPAMIFFTASLDADTAVEAMRLGAHDYASKARITAGELRRIVTNALERSRLRREVDVQREQLREQNLALAGELHARRETEQLLRNSIALSHSIFESSGDCITILDLKGSVLDMNWRQTAALHGSAGQDGLTLMEIYGAESAQARETVREALTAAVDGGCGRFETTTAEGRRWWDIQITPIREENGQPVRLLAISRDITGAKRIEEQLREAKAAAEKANRAKEDFLATLSHELRTPLNPVLLLASECENDPGLDGQLRRDFATIRKNVELEARLIDDLLDLTRISRGKMRLELRPVEVHESLSATCELLRTDFAQKEICLTYAPDSSPAWMQGDPVRLQQIFWNLLKNAIRFTPKRGTIEVRSRRPVPARLEVTVRDSGSGIAPDDLKTIFGAFEQGREGHREGGLGLGLAITMGLVEMHGGNVKAESDGPGKGAVFTVELPLLPEEDGPGAMGVGAGSGTSAPAGRRVLLVEDHRETSDALTRLLRARGYEVQGAYTIREGLKLAAAAAFDLILSDISLPDGSGYELMEGMRKLQPGVPAIAMSGHGMDSDRARSTASGFLEHLVKPVRINDLEQAIARVVASLGNS